MGWRLALIGSKVHIGLSVKETDNNIIIISPAFESVLEMIVWSKVTVF